MYHLALFSGGFGPMEIALIAVVALLLFGRRLPEVGKSLGKGIVEFKKGLQGIEDSIDDAGKKGETKTEAKPRQPDQLAAQQQDEKEARFSEQSYQKEST